MFCLLLEVQTVGQTPLPLFSHFVHSLNEAGKIDSEILRRDCIFELDTGLDYL